MKVLLFTLLCSASLTKGMNTPLQIERVIEESLNLNCRFKVIKSEITKIKFGHSKLDLLLPTLEEAKAAEIFTRRRLRHIKNIVNLINTNHSVEDIADSITAYNNKNNRATSHYSSLKDKSESKPLVKGHHKPRPASAPLTTEEPTIAKTAHAFEQISEESDEDLESTSGSTSGSTSEEEGTDSNRLSIGGLGLIEFSKKFGSCRSASAPATMTAYSHHASIDTEEVTTPQDSGALSLLRL